MRLFTIVLITIILTACQSEKDIHFQLLKSEKTGISFVNQITENDSINMVDFSYLYNGGGVGVGDINNDGLVDVYFTANQGSSKLYLNKGNLTFDDITITAGVNTSGWCTGVTFADVNADGLLDIYVCKSGNTFPQNRRNLLFINQGIQANGVPTFVEKATDFGVAEEGNSTQAAFFDYDKDGDLDLYVMNATNDDRTPNRIKPIIKNGNSAANDKLYRNETISTNAVKKSVPLFVEVSTQAHILDDAWGLGLSINDVNNDGWEDIFVSNDFLGNDLLYLNNHDGTFSEQANNAFGHTSQFAMGNDISDINNDGWMDIFTADMLPIEDQKRKKMAGSWSYETFEMAQQNGYMPQYMRNTLQLNNGLDAEGNINFSEIAQIANVAATDWSWSPFLADLDNDGWKDLLISNGYRRDITDLDFIAYNAENQLNDERIKDLAKKQPDYKTLNRLFKNNADLTFTDKTLDWGVEEPSFSNGALAVDLDNDGDLDIVCNNIDEQASIYENITKPSIERNYLKLKLIGSTQNIFALGAKITVVTKDKKQVYHHSVTRGYQSSSDYVIHFGLGNAQVVDSVYVDWTDGRKSVLSTITANQLITVNIQQSKAVNQVVMPKITPQIPILMVENKDSHFNDFSRQSFLLSKLSNDGLKITKGDINKDGADDFYVCGTVGQSGRFYLSRPDGTFQLRTLTDKIPMAGESDALLFDADYDQDLDLYVVKNGNQSEENITENQDKLYLNDGKGTFNESKGLIPDEQANGSCVRACDFDHDGDVDIFVGGKSKNKAYSQADNCMFLENIGGRFKNITPIALKNIGIVTDAIWADIDGDKFMDLVVVGEYMPITMVKNLKGKSFEMFNNEPINSMFGLWKCIQGADFDHDGDIDFLVGNYGVNNLFQVSTNAPLTMYYGDFDGNKRTESIHTFYLNGKETMAHTRDEMTRQLNGFRKQFPSYQAYSTINVTDFLATAHPQRFQANRLSSIYLENKGSGAFSPKSLPNLAQISVVQSFLIHDFNADGHLDAYLVGNNYGIETSFGQQDASVGLLLVGNGKGDFEAISPTKNPYKMRGDCRDIKLLKNKKTGVLVFSKYQN